MILGGMGIMRLVVGMPGIIDCVSDLAVVAGVRCRVLCLTGMIAFLESVVSLLGSPRIIIGVMFISGPQRGGNEGQCGKRSQGGCKSGGGVICFHTVSQTREAGGNSNDFGFLLFPAGRPLSLSRSGRGRCQAPFIPKIHQEHYANDIRDFEEMFRLRLQLMLMSVGSIRHGNVSDHLRRCYKAGGCGFLSGVHAACAYQERPVLLVEWSRGIRSFIVRIRTSRGAQRRFAILTGWVRIGRPWGTPITWGRTCMAGRMGMRVPD